MPRGPGHAVKNMLLIVLAFFLPPCAVACVTGCDINFALNVIFTLFLTYMGGIIHAICIVVIYGFREEEMPRVRRRARLHARREGLHYGPAPPTPRYDTRPACTTDFPAAAAATTPNNDIFGENVYVAGGCAKGGSAFAGVSANTTRGNDYGLEVYPGGEAAPGDIVPDETMAADAGDFRGDQKNP